MSSEVSQLDRIMARTRQRVAERKAAANLVDLERRASAHTPRGFVAALRRVALLGPAVIAESKKASPSKGILRDPYDPAAIARSYAAAGAAAISVLTDEDFFRGSLADLSAVSNAVSIPVLRKDFVLDPFQILEARAARADAILLIVAAHDDQTLCALSEEARQMQLDVLCEVHDAAELHRALNLGFNVIGVNSRNLKTLQVHPSVHEELLPSIPANILRVAESGISNSGDLNRLRTAGYDAFLIGEAFMRQPDPGAALKLLIAPVS